MAKRTPTPGEKIAQEIYETYKPTTVEEMQSALKSVFDRCLKPLLKVKWIIIWVIPRTAVPLRIPKIREMGILGRI